MCVCACWINDAIQWSSKQLADILKYVKCLCSGRLISSGRTCQTFTRGQYLQPMSIHINILFSSSTQNIHLRHCHRLLLPIWIQAWCQEQNVSAALTLPTASLYWLVGHSQALGCTLQQLSNQHCTPTRELPVFDSAHSTTAFSFDVRIVWVAWECETEHKPCFGKVKVMSQNHADT